MHALGGYRVQGRGASEAGQLRKDAEDLAAAGAGMIILEMIPATLARELTESLSVPVIGIGAGAGCSGQVLVLHDMLGIGLQKMPKFVRNFLDGHDSIQAAVRQYVADVKANRFPDDALARLLTVRKVQIHFNRRRFAGCAFPCSAISDLVPTKYWAICMTATCRWCRRRGAMPG